MNNRRLLALALLVAGLMNGLPAHAATEEERIRLLEQQLRQQQEALETMQAELRRLKAASATAAPAGSASEPRVSGAREENALKLNLYGFAQADMIYDFERVDPDWNDTLRVTTIPTEDGAFGNDGEFVFSVRQSRLGVKGNYGPDITFMLEAELFGTGGDEGQTTPRLRHAWATYKQFGMGQYWSNFMDIDVFPNTIDYWGPTGMVFYRNQQARYSFPMGDDEFSISLEDPDTALTVGRFRSLSSCDLPNAPADCDSIESSADEFFQAHNRYPDLTARYRNNGDFGHWQLAGMARQLGYERLDNGSDEEEFGWGVNASAGLNFLERDVLKLQVVYGEGIGNYMNDGGLDIAPDSANLADANAEAVPLLGVLAYYDHYWNDRWSTSVGWSMIDLDTSDGQDGSEFETGQIAQINLLHYPADHVLMGTEFIWGEREDIDGASGTDYRIQFSLKVSFDSGDLMMLGR